MDNENNVNIIEQWIDLWGEWLDSLLTTGIASISSDTHAQIATWSSTAELLAFHQQLLLANKFIDDATPVNIKSDIFYQLIDQQNLLKRLYEAQLLENQRV